MPTLDFVLPHWLYWLGLVVFPLIAMVLAQRVERSGRDEELSVGVAFLMLITAGFVGLHRFYVKSWLGIVYLFPFIGILYANGEHRLAREAVSAARNDRMIADFDIDRFTTAVERGEAGSAEKLAAARETVEAVILRVAAATDSVETWSTVAATLAGLIALMVVADAFLLPRMVRHLAERERDIAAGQGPDFSEAPPTPARATPEERPGGFTGIIETVSRYSGEYVAYWSVIAVFVYYYEVLARYVFNSPTNWAHESMFLMFGMQYLISGAYAYLNDSHVRVDVFYARLSRRGKALSDIATSAFFFIFAGTMLVTGWIFMMDSIRVWEVSFTEWAIQYWPVKITITVGALLLLAQGLAKLAKDIAVVTREAH